MSTEPDSDNLRHLNSFDHIAKDLPADLKAAYYRELMHCRSLPENDEMLRIIRILQLLTYLIQQAPATVVSERKKFEALFASFTEILGRTAQSVHEYQEHLDRRLAELPEDIARRIQPEAIAAAIYESVRQEFARTGLLQIGQGFEKTSSTLENVLARLNKTTDGLEAGRNAVVREVREGSERFLQEMYQTSESLIREGQQISHKNRWQRDAFACLVIVVVFLLGMRYDRWLHSDPSPVEQTIAPVSQESPPPPVEPRQRPRKP